MDRKAGARGLRSIMESVLLPTMYELPDLKHATKVVVDERNIKDNSEPLIIYQNPEAGIAQAASDE